MHQYPFATRKIVLSLDTDGPRYPIQSKKNEIPICRRHLEEILTQMPKSDRFLAIMISCLGSNLYFSFVFCFRARKGKGNSCNRLTLFADDSKRNYNVKKICLFNRGMGDSKRRELALLAFWRFSLPESR